MFQEALGLKQFKYWKVKALPLFIFILLYGFSYNLAKSSQHAAAGSVLIALAVFFYFWHWRLSRSFVNLMGLFSLSWLGGEGLACFQLSNLQVDWEPASWVSFGAAYALFYIGYHLRSVPKEGALKNAPSGKAGSGSVPERPEIPEKTLRRIRNCIVSLTVISAASIAVEALVLGFLPILSDKPHAYSYFHISGVHYFSVLFVLVPSLTVIWYLYSRKTGEEGKKAIFSFLTPEILICTVISLILPVLIVSRMQLILAIVFAVLTWLLIRKEIPLKYLIAAGIAVVAGWAVLTVFRHHDVAYLNGIFEMKNANTPIWFSHPYIYITNNYDNFNCLVRDLPEHTRGMRMLFPFLALSGLKFLRPAWINYPLFLTKAELTTLTLFYDAYYDFGVLGVAAFAFLLGLISCFAERKTTESRNPVFVLLCTQLAAYLLLSFFSTWFSTPVVWFWLGVTVLMILYTGGYVKKLLK